MAIKLIANYSKRLGLPGYSSHQFSVSIETELMTTDDVAGESGRIYELLQGSVDEQITRTGFVPGPEYGMDDGASPSPSSHNGNGAPPSNGEAHWKCSEKQKDLILKLVDEHSLDKDEVDHLARQRFGKGVRYLNKVEASGLIDELLEQYGDKRGRRDNGRKRGSYAANNGRGGRS